MSDFALIPNYVLTRRVKFVTKTTEAESGKKRRLSKRAAGIYGFSLMFERLTTADANTLWAFYVAKKGGGTSFTWTNPITSVEYTVVFADDDLAQGYWMHGKYRCEVNFEVVS